MASVKKKKEREKVIKAFWSKSMPNDMDVITDVIDRGDHLKITSCTKDTTAWWLSTLRTIYPQDHCGGRGDDIKMHPEMGVTLQLSKGDGTLRIKGKKHMQWFNENFDQLIEQGSKESDVLVELGKVIDSSLRLDDGYTIRELLRHLPATGALKHGPTYIYRLWRALLDRWFGEDGDVYVITPLLDARRLADVILLLVKHRTSRCRVHIFTMPQCDGDARFPTVLKEARDMIRSLKGPNKRRLVAEERLKMAEQRMEAKFGRFHCKLIAQCRDDHAELLVTSASFHRFHYDMESGDTVLFFQMAADSLINYYLAPLGLEHQVSFADSPSTSQAETSTSQRSPSTPGPPDDLSLPPPTPPP